MPHSYGASFSGVRWLGLMSLEKSRMSTTRAPPAAMKTQTESQLVRYVFVIRKSETRTPVTRDRGESSGRNIPNAGRPAQLVGEPPGVSPRHTRFAGVFWRFAAPLRALSRVSDEAPRRELTSVAGEPKMK